MTAPDTTTQHPDDRDKHSTTEDRARRIRSVTTYRLKNLPTVKENRA